MEKELDGGVGGAGGDDGECVSGGQARSVRVGRVPAPPTHFPQVSMTN